MKQILNSIVYSVIAMMLCLSGVAVQASARQLKVVGESAEPASGPCCASYICQTDYGCTQPGCSTCNTKADQCGTRGLD
jgi:hypothetical protein